MSDTNIDLPKPHSEEFAIDVINIALKIFHEINDNNGDLESDDVLKSIRKITPKVKLLINQVINNKELIKDS